MQAARQPATGGPRWDGVLFDFGGTLDSDGIHWSRRFDQVFRTLGFTYADAALDAAFRCSEEAVTREPAVRSMNLPRAIRYQVDLMLPALGVNDPALAERAAEQLAAETRATLHRNGDALRLLTGRVRLGILSNFTGNLELILREEGLRPLVDAVFDSAVVGLRKPDPAFFLHALDLLGVAPGRAAMVGDSVDMDLLPARALGMTAMWVRGVPHRPTEFRPDHTVASAAAAVALLTDAS